MFLPQFEIVKFLRFRSVFLLLFSGQIGNRKSLFFSKLCIELYKRKGKQSKGEQKQNTCFLFFIIRKNQINPTQKGKKKVQNGWQKLFTTKMHSIKKK